MSVSCAAEPIEEADIQLPRDLAKNHELRREVEFFVSAFWPALQRTEKDHDG